MNIKCQNLLEVSIIQIDGHIISVMLKNIFVRYLLVIAYELQMLHGINLNLC
jgi:hypothetical protein